MLKAYSYILSLGTKGLNDVSKLAVLNANYIKESLKDILNLPYDRPCMHECVFNDKNLKDFRNPLPYIAGQAFIARFEKVMSSLLCPKIQERVL